MNSRYGKETDFNRYETNSAGHKIDGYFEVGAAASQRKTDEQRFLDARTECAKHLERQLACVRALTFETFMAKRRKGFNS